MSDLKQELIPVPPANGDVAPTSEAAFNATIGSAAVPFYSTFNPQTPEGGQLLYKAMMAADDELMKLVGETIRVEHVYAADYEYADPKTHEVHNLTAIVVFTPDGKAYRCSSKGVKKSIFLMRGLFGLPPWPGGKPVKVTLERLKNGNNWLLLLPVVEAAKPGKAGGK